VKPNTKKRVKQLEAEYEKEVKKKKTSEDTGETVDIHQHPDNTS